MSSLAQGWAGKVMPRDCGTWIKAGSSVTCPHLGWLQAGVDVRQLQRCQKNSWDSLGMAEEPEMRKTPPVSMKGMPVLRWQLHLGHVYGLDHHSEARSDWEGLKDSAGIFQNTWKTSALTPDVKLTFNLTCQTWRTLLGSQRGFFGSHMREKKNLCCQGMMWGVLRSSKEFTDGNGAGEAHEARRKIKHMDLSVHACSCHHWLSCEYFKTCSFVLNSLWFRDNPCIIRKKT